MTLHNILFLLLLLGLTTAINAQETSPTQAASSAKAPQRLHLKAPPDQIVLSVARLGCYWGCREYRIDVDAAGKVTFSGKRRTSTVGQATGKIEPEVAMSLINNALQANILNAAESYFNQHRLHELRDGPLVVSDVHISDGETSLIELRIGTFTKSVRLYSQTPPDLERTVNLVELTTNAKQWINGARKLADNDPYKRAIGRQDFSLKSPDPQKRASAARELSKFEIYDLVVPLAEALSDSNAEVRENAARALANPYLLTPTDPAFQAASRALIKALADENRQVRYASAGALGQWASPESIAALAPMLKMSDPGIQTQTIRSLVMLNAIEQNTESLVALLRSTEFTVRIEAAKALTEFDLFPQSEIETLKEKLETQTGRKSVMETIRLIGPVASKTVPALDKILSKGSEWDDHRHACQALLAINTPSAKRVLIKHASKCALDLAHHRNMEWTWRLRTY